ncbi:hypothetical protein [Ottowia sp.]|uniref:hypothetical protein n=1 Tax=Ottowia sp. TaxID=1898956 RepID=UPI0026187439|nr:hypothetical protein [Ottowia sp.]
MAGESSISAQVRASVDPSMPVRHFHTLAGLGDASLLAGYRFCEGLMRSRGLAMMGLAVRSKANLDGSIRAVYGDMVTRLLDRENRSDLRGTVVQLLTEKIQVRRLTGPVLAAYLAPALLPRVIAAQGVTDIVFVPQTESDLEDYLEACPDSTECYPMSFLALDVLAP